MGNHWFAITGKTSPSDNARHYMYFDDIRLFRQCDIDSACFPATGQICPLVALQAPPAPPFVVKNISNANSLKLKIAAIGGQVLVDTTFTNPNGLPDFFWPGEILGNNVASGNYGYEMVIGNKCGAMKEEGLFQVQNGIYDTLGPWIDSTAAWSEVPVQCCLSTLTLRDIELNGDLCYMVKDTIWVEDGVSATPGSNILIQAGQVVELDSVEFDGSNTVVEILSQPCTGCRLAPPSPGGKPPKPEEIGKSAVITQGRPAAWASAEENAPASFAKSGLDMGEGEPESDYSEFETDLWAYPNPFAGMLNLEVELPNAGPVSLTVYDLHMREVRKVVEGVPLGAGSHGFAVDMAGEPSGLYMVQLVAGGRTLTEKVVKR